MRALAYVVCTMGCIQPIGVHQQHRPDAGDHDSSLMSKDGGVDADGLPRTCREAFTRGTTTDGVVTIDPDGPGGQPELSVYCDMTTAGGGWMLVMAAGFTNYPNFSNGSNAVTPRPNWGVPTQGTPVSTAMSTDPATPGALDFATWPSFGSEFMIASSINHWIQCTPGTGSFVTFTEGTVSCQVVKQITAQCPTTAPDHFYMYNTGPSLTVGTNRQNLYYLFDGSTNGNWPTHDPCGTNQTNQLHNVAQPMTWIYLRASM